MATSGSTDYAITTATITQKVLESLAVIAIGATASAAHTAAITELLNLFAKATPGIKVWKTEWTQKTFSASSEVTGDDSNIYTCILGHAAAADNRPITGASYSTYWAKTGDTGGTWVTGTAYTSTGNFTDSTSFLGISQAFLRKDENDTQVKIITRREYMDSSEKMTLGDPTKLWYDKQSGKTHLLPVPSDTDSVLHYTRMLRIEDFDATGDAPDFPIEWAGAIIWGVAVDGLGLYTVSADRERSIRSNAKRYMKIALDTDVESFDSIQFFV